MLEFDQKLEQIIPNYNTLIQNLKAMDQLKNLAPRLKEIHPKMTNLIGQLTEEYISARGLKSNEFSPSEILNLRNQIDGIKIPVPFIVYAKYTACDERFDILMSFRNFREGLGKNYQQKILSA